MHLDLLPRIAGLSFDPQHHRYSYASERWGVVQLDSVSQVLQSTGAKAFNPAAWRRSLMERNGWTNEEAEKFIEWHRSTRANIGSQFHALVETWILQGGRTMPLTPTEDSPEQDWMFAHWLEHFAPLIETVRIVEQPLLHRGALFTGTPDLLMESANGKLCVVDWKTCQASRHRVRDEWLLQMGAYCALIESCYNLRVEHGANVIVAEDGVVIKNWNRADLEQGWRKFAGFLMEHHARQASFGDHLSRLALQAMEPMFA